MGSSLMVSQSGSLMRTERTFTGKVNYRCAVLTSPSSLRSRVPHCYRNFAFEFLEVLAEHGRQLTCFTIVCIGIAPGIARQQDLVRYAPNVLRNVQPKNR